METKKSNTKNLENKRAVFFQLGLVVTLAAALVAFEWASEPNQNSLTAYNDLDNWIPEDIDNVRRTERKPPEIKKPEIPEFKVVVDEEDIEESEFDIKTVFDEEDIIEMYRYPEDDEPEIGDDDIFFIVEDMPTFKGEGLSKFQAYVQQNVVYPEAAIEMHIQGRVFVQFVIDEQGNLVNAAVVKGVDPLLDNEVMRVLDGSPKWKAGMQRKMPVKVSFTMPVFFKLSN